MQFSLEEKITHKQKNLTSVLDGTNVNRLFGFGVKKKKKTLKSEDTFEIGIK